MKHRHITTVAVLGFIMLVMPLNAEAQTEPRDSSTSDFIISASLKAAIQGYINCKKVGDSLIAVESKDSERWGFIDMSGRLVIPCQYLDVGPFSEGLARVSRLEDAKQEYIDDKYYGRTPYGLMMKYTYINKRGERVISDVYDVCGDFHNGLAYVRDANEKYGFIDKTGTMVIPCVLDAAHNFSDSLALVKVDDKWFFIDLSGHISGPGLFEEGRIRDYHEGLAAAADADKDWDYTQWRYIDKNGMEVVPGKWDQVFRFSEGYAVVDYSKVIDRKGTEVFKLKDNVYTASGSDLSEEYTNAAFSEGLLFVKNDNTNEGGFVDRQGHMVIPLTTKLYLANPFSCGLAFVELYCGEEMGTRYGFVDKHGNYTFSAAEIRMHEQHIRQYREWQKQHEAVH